MDLIFIMLPADWIAIVNIITTSFIGIWIARTVQNSLATNRGLKDHYIEVIRSLNSDYNSFLETLYHGKTDSKTVQEWCKIMNLKLETVEQSIHLELIVEPEVLGNHIKLKQFVTKTSEFDVQYSNQNLLLNPSTKINVQTIQRDINNAFVRLIVDVNKAKKR